MMGNNTEFYELTCGSCKPGSGDCARCVSGRKKKKYARQSETLDWLRGIFNVETDLSKYTDMIA